MTWLLGGQPSQAEVVKGEKEALVIVPGFWLPVNRLLNFFSNIFFAGLCLCKTGPGSDLEPDVQHVAVFDDILLAVKLYPALLLRAVPPPGGCYV